MATDVMGEEDSVQGDRQRSMRAQSAAGRNAAEQGRRAPRAGRMGSNVREVVRETVYATYDALRGRYDR
jgi:hypothetical protein